MCYSFKNADHIIRSFCIHMILIILQNPTVMIRKIDNSGRVKSVQNLELNETVY